MKNYWIVGAFWGSEGDQSLEFYKKGYWRLGWKDEKQPRMACMRNAMRPGDRVALKSMRGPGSPFVKIKALGIVRKESDEEGRVDIKWLIKFGEREVDSKGCYASIHGPYSMEEKKHRKWLRDIFCL